MAFVYSVLRFNFCKQLYNVSQFQTSVGLRSITFNILEATSNNKTLPSWNSSRNTSHSFFARITAERLWKGATGVSNAGRKKGRGKGTGRKLTRDLNRGQVIGFGKINMRWPGLNAPVIQGRELVQQVELPPDENREKRLHEMRDKFVTRRFNKIHPLERGWSGTKLGGRSLGPPDPVGDELFEGFDSRVLQFKVVMHVTGQRGKVRGHSAIVVTGNKKGLAGFSVGRSVNGKTSANRAKNRAAKQLRYIERFEERTVLHDFHASFGAVKVFVEQRPAGHGIISHRAIKCMCEMIGIKDLYAKVEGPTKNIRCVTKAFFIGLMRQKSHQQLADERGLHVVRLRKNRDFYPEVIASPTNCRHNDEIGPTELLDYKLYLYGGKVAYPRKIFQPFFVNFPSYIRAMKEREHMRNHRDVEIFLRTHYGECVSFLQLREREKERQKLLETVEEKEKSEEVAV